MADWGMASSQAIDRSAIESLKHLAGNGDVTSLLSEVVSTFISSSPSLLAAMKDSLKNNDAKALRDAAHSLKSSSALVGAHRLSKACELLELCKVISPESISLIDSAHTHYDAAVIELRAIVSQANS